MISAIAYFFTKKRLIVYEDHRQITPLINSYNRRDYWFFTARWIWSTVRWFKYAGWNYQVAYFLLRILNPEIIISKNWVIKRDILYYLWAKKNEKKFIVVQHGAYVGGIVTLADHRYARCDVFYTWGTYFTALFEKYNRRNDHCRIVNFGNPIFNALDREKYSYRPSLHKKVLLLPSAGDAQERDVFVALMEKLEQLGFEVYLKTHALQFRKAQFPTERLLTQNIYQILAEQRFSAVIINHSTALLDAVFFRQPVLYFDAEQKDTVYGRYLENLYPSLPELKSSEQLIAKVDFPAQEKLFADLITIGDNQLQL